VVCTCTGWKKWWHGGKTCCMISFAPSGSKGEARAWLGASLPNFCCDFQSARYVRRRFPMPMWLNYYTMDRRCEVRPPHI
jgi:hypothetical protein